MEPFSRLWRRFQRWLRSGLEPALGEFAVEDSPADPSPSDQTKRKLDACNQALAAAVDARDRLRELVARLNRSRHLLQSDLQRSAQHGDDRLGAAHALRLHELDAEQQDLQHRLQEAQSRVDELLRLREHILAPPSGSG